MQDSNPQPPDPKSGALSVELIGQANLFYRTDRAFSTVTRAAGRGADPPATCLQRQTEPCEAIVGSWTIIARGAQCLAKATCGGCAVALTLIQLR